MKKTKICATLPLFTILASSLVSCGVKEKGKLLFGSLVATNQINNIRYIELQNLIANEETFILVTAYDIENNSCLCWTTYINSVVPSFLKEEKLIIYVFDTLELKEQKDSFNITYDNTTSSPCLYIFNKGDNVKEFKERDYNKLFSDPSGKTMKEYIYQFLDKPNLFFVDDEYISNNLNKENEQIILFIRKSCSDCSYCLPEVIHPYFNNKNLETDIWVYDLDPIKNSNETEYQNIKDKYGLSIPGNEIFGYQQGVVPTIQHYSNGILDDAAVYFNDQIRKENDSFIIEDSYYSSERIKNLKFYENCHEPLKGMMIENEEINSYEEMNYYQWKNEYSSKHHNKILNKFLDYYIKK